MGKGGHGHMGGMRGRDRSAGGEEKQPEINYKKLIYKIAPLLWPKTHILQLKVWACGLTLLLARVCNVLVPILYKDVVNSLAGSHGPVVFPASLILSYTFLKLIQNLQRDLRAFVYIDVELDTSRRIKIMVFTHLHSLSLKYHLSRKTGEVLKVMERGAQSLQSLLSMGLFTVIPTIIDLFLVCIVLMNFVDPLFSVIIMATMLSYWYLTVKLTDWRKKFRRAMIDADNAQNDRAVNSLLNFETVKYFVMEEREVEHLQTKILEYNKESWKNDASLYALNAAQQIVIATGTFLCMWLAGKHVANEQMTVGDFVMVITYLVQLAQPLAWLGTAWRIIQQGFIDMEKMFALLEVKPEIVDSPGCPALLVKEGSITFDKVKFSYEPSRPILNGISLHIEAGHTCAFVGPTGAGKSTIGRLLFRFYDLERVGAGSIRIDGVDVREVQQASLRRAIGVVPQDTVLFNDTIRYNLMYGRPDATEDEMIEAARAASIHDAIMGFTDKYDTIVGERGLRLSGGEKQRVAIARTILKSPKIVLLDEATSALDTQMEQQIQGALNIMSKGRTTLIIAHRLSTIIHAEKICVLKEGEICEEGSHLELVERGGEYAQMWRRQWEQRDGGASTPGMGTPITSVVKR